MKKPILARMATMLFISSFFLISCSKDSLSKPEDIKSINNNDVINNKSSLGHDIKKGSSDVYRRGSIDAFVLPQKAMVTVVLYGDGYQSDDIIPDENGYIQIDGLWAGSYTMVINASNPAFLSLKVPDIIVVEDQATDLGEIFLDTNPNYGRPH